MRLCVWVCALRHLIWTATGGSLSLSLLVHGRTMFVSKHNPFPSPGIINNLSMMFMRMCMIAPAFGERTLETGGGRPSACLFENVWANMRLEHSGSWWCSLEHVREYYAYTVYNIILTKRTRLYNIDDLCLLSIWNINKCVNTLMCVRAPYATVRHYWRAVAS